MILELKEILPLIHFVSNSKVTAHILNNGLVKFFWKSQTVV